jgi:hypothetical protein
MTDDRSILRAIAREGLADAEKLVERLKTVLAELGADDTLTDDESDFHPTNVISVKQAAHRFSMDETTVTRLCRDHGIGHKKPGRREWDVSIPRMQRYRNRNTTNQVE